MVSGETPMETARRHFRQQQALIARQKDLIARLAAIGESTKLAEQVLETMERTLAITRSELERRSPWGP